MSSAFRLDQIYILCTVDCRLKIGFSHIYVSYTIFFFSLIWSSSGIKLSYLACNFYPSDSNDQHCWRVLLHVISSVLSTSTVYQNQLARLWKKKTRKCQISVLRHAILKNHSVARVWVPKTLVWRRIEFASCPGVGEFSDCRLFSKTKRTARVIS